MEENGEYDNNVQLEKGKEIYQKLQTDYIIGYTQFIF